MKILDSCNTLEELIGFSKQPGQNTWGFIILSRFKTPTFQIQCLRIASALQNCSQPEK